MLLIFFPLNPVGSEYSVLILIIMTSMLTIDNINLQNDANPLQEPFPFYLFETLNSYLDKELLFDHVS